MPKKRLTTFAGCLLACALLAGAGVKVSSLWPDTFPEQTRADAEAAVEALQEADLAVLDGHLSAHRADPAFAYLFTSQATPRALGDALATVADDDLMRPAASEAEGPPSAAGLDSGSYGRVLGDLADALALATRGTGELALPASWTDDFVAYTLVS